MPMKTDTSASAVVLLADHFVIEAEDVLANETWWRACDGGPLPGCSCLCMCRLESLQLS